MAVTTLEDEEKWLWSQIKAEVHRDADSEPALASYLYSMMILSHSSLERSLSFHLGNKFCSSMLLSTLLYDLFLNTFTSDPSLRAATVADLYAARTRDPACVSFSHCLLNYKGFLACQAHRVAQERLETNTDWGLGFGAENEIVETWETEQGRERLEVFRFCLLRGHSVEFGRGSGCGGRICRSSEVERTCSCCSNITCCWWIHSGEYVAAIFVEGGRGGGGRRGAEAGSISFLFFGRATSASACRATSSKVGHHAVHISVR